MKHKSVSYNKWGIIFCLPFVLAFLIFSLYPIIYTCFIGFTDLKGAGMTNIHVLANPFQNFITIFKNRSFQRSLSNTALLWVLNFVPQIALALLLTAWFTNKYLHVRGQGAFKVLLYMPNIITAGTIAVLFNALLSYPVGAVNSLLQTLGIIKQPFNFLIDSTVAKGTVAFVQFWMWYGNTMIVLIAGVLGINPALFEAAAIDGANSWQTFFQVTLPSLRTILLYTLITSMIGGIQMFDIPKLFLNGGPSNATLTTSLFIYNQAFQGSFMYNRAAAASMIMFVITAILSGILFYIMRDRDAAKLKKEERLQRKMAKGARA